MNNYVLQAIREKRAIELRYNDGGSRLVEPHAYGLGVNGDDLLCCYQIASASELNDPLKWKLLNLTEIQSIHVTENRFTDPRSGYKRDDAAIPTIFAQL